jgi:hypothetical protein
VKPLAEIERRLDELETEASRVGPDAAAEILALGEEVLEHWVTAKGLVPTQETREDFRLLALHRQGCTDDPSFNACRETGRELAYHYNLITTDPRHAATPQRLTMMTMVARHLFLFVAGKMQVAALGDFCCASRPIRQETESQDIA